MDGGNYIKQKKNAEKSKRQSVVENHILKNRHYKGTRKRK